MASISYTADPFLYIFIVRYRLISTVLHKNNDLAIVARGGGQAPLGVPWVYVYVQLHRSGFLVRIYAALYVNLYKVGPMWT